MTHPEQQYLDLLRDILDNGVKQTDKGTGDVTYSLFGRHMRFNLSKDFPLLTTKKTYWKGILHELYWFMSGQSNIKYLVDNKVHIWDDYPYRIYREKVKKGLMPELTKDDFIEKIAGDVDFAKQHGELPFIYGQLWRRWPTKDQNHTVDQLQWVVETLRRDPDAHNTIVNSWNPEYLYEMAQPEQACRFPICHNMFQCNVKDGKLSLQLYQRSADIFLGVPFNIASYALLTAILAQITGNQPGEFVHTFGDVHIYENHREQAKEQLTRQPKPLPTIKLDPNIKNLTDFTPDKVELQNYEAHPPIKAEMAVVGGIVDEDWKKYAQTKS